MRADLRAGARRMRTSDPSSAARLWMVLLPLLKQAGTPPQVLAAATRAHELAAAAGDSRLEARAALLRGRAWYDGEPGDHWAWLEAGMTAALELGDRRLEAYAHEARASRLLHAGRLEETTACIDLWLERSDHPDARFLQPMAFVFLAIVERKRPTRPWLHVRTLLEQGLADATAAGNTGGQLWCAELLAVRYCNDVEPELLEAVLDSVQQRDLLPFQQRFILQMRAALARQREDYAEAKMLFSIVLSAQQGGVFDRQMQRVSINLVFLHLLLGESAAAERELRRAIPINPWHTQQGAFLRLVCAVVDGECGRYAAACERLEGLLADPVFGGGEFAFVGSIYLAAIHALAGDRARAAAAIPRITTFDSTATLSWVDAGVATCRVFAGLDTRPADPHAWLRSLPGGEHAIRADDLLILLRWLERLDG